MSEVPLETHSPRPAPGMDFRSGSSIQGYLAHINSIQGYLVHKNQPPPLGLPGIILTVGTLHLVQGNPANKKQRPPRTLP